MCYLYRPCDDRILCFRCTLGRAIIFSTVLDTIAARTQKLICLHCEKVQWPLTVVALCDARTGDGQGRARVCMRM